MKVYVEDSYYHVYSRGWNKSEIFCCSDDYEYFEWLLERSLSKLSYSDHKGREYKNFRLEGELVAYCLMPNHFHIVVFQRDDRFIEYLMSSILTAYAIYFNRKYSRRGPLAESAYKAVLITTGAQLKHITRYVHLNHIDFKSWAYSSYNDYVVRARDWVCPGKILALFSSTKQYVDFVGDYEAMKRYRDAHKQDY